MTKEEVDFSGSPLQTAIRNSDKELFDKYKSLSITALENHPESKFWKDAVEFLNQINKK